MAALTTLLRMPTRRSRTALACFLAAAAVATVTVSPAAGKPRAQWASVNSYIPSRIDATIGFIPSHGMAPPNRAPHIATVRNGGRTFRFVYQNSAAVWPDTGLIVRTLSGRYANSTAGGFVDRRLTAKQRRRLVVRVDLGRDADVVVVAAGHPACGAGLTVAQARGIARGAITRWSQVVALAPGAPDAIAVRVEQTSTGGKVPRWGVIEDRKFAKGTRAAADGGLGQVASGDQALAALTSWTRARAYRGVCAVPIGGVAPTDASVFELRYPAAFPISYVAARRPFRSSTLSRAMMTGFVDWLRSGEAAALFRARGMMLVADGIPEPAPVPPAQDSAPPSDNATMVEQPPPGAVEIAGPEG